MLFGHRVSKQPGLSRRQLCPSLFLSPPPCCSWLLFQLYGWPYVFFLLPNYSENFPGENWTSILLFDWIFLIEDLRIILKREKKNPFTQGPDWAALLGTVTQSSSSRLLFLSSPLDFHMLSLVKSRSSPGSGRWQIPLGFGFAGRFWVMLVRQVQRSGRQGQARQGWQQLQCPWCSFTLTNAGSSIPQRRVTPQDPTPGSAGSVPSLWWGFGLTHSEHSSSAWW